METVQGIPVSPGVAIAEALVVLPRFARVRRRTLAAEHLDDELFALDAAIAASTADLDALSEKTAASLGGDIGRIFDFHRGMLADPNLLSQIRGSIRNERVGAAYAVHSVFQRYAENFRALQDRYLRERVSDLFDLERRLLGHLDVDATPDLHEVKQPCVVVAEDLTPSQTAGLDKRLVRGIVTDAGGRTSHTAILAHALGIPAVVGVERATQVVNPGDTVIVDGNRGVVISSPNGPQLLEYREAIKRQKSRDAKRAELRAAPARTRDGTEIELLANIEFPHETREAIDNGAAGIGLYRTEFVFLAADHEPTEDEQYAAYREAIAGLDGRPLTVRTLDLGADKVADYLEDGGPGIEANPVLGCRSIRLCLQNLPMFKTQLRAILRASAEGPVRIMFPLISSIMELRQARMVLSDVREDLTEEGVAFADDIPVGMMIEVPSAALQARTFAPEVDFFSVGTNDLVQYTLAVDRGNERVAPLFSAAHPAVLMLLKDVLRSADRSQTPVSVCGEMAGQPEFTMLLLGLGLRTFSMSAPSIPEIKEILRAVSIDQCRRVARKAAGFDSAREVVQYLRDELGRILPESYGNGGNWD